MKELREAVVILLIIAVMVTDENFSTGGSVQDIRHLAGPGIGFRRVGMEGREAWKR